MLIDDGLLRRDDGRWTLGELTGELPVPPTIQALLARAPRAAARGGARAARARLGRGPGLPPRGDARARARLARAGDVDRSLTALVRSDMIRPDRSSLRDDEAFRFRHMLIRDAAYRSLPKETRAELHERFADWLEEWPARGCTSSRRSSATTSSRRYRFLAELGPLDAEAEALAARGSQRLESAGRSALAPQRPPAAAVTLLERAAALRPATMRAAPRCCPSWGRR